MGSTLGASGRTVVIENDFGGAHITKDGVTVAESIQVMDPVENLGMTMLKQAAKNTASKAGDGTTTSTVLAQAIIHNYIEKAGNHSFRDIRKGIDDALEYTVNQLDRRSVEVNEKTTYRTYRLFQLMETRSLGPSLLRPSLKQVITELLRTKRPGRQTHT